MKTIASFRINHDTLTPGLYTSRVDGDVVTYDVRFVCPNTPPYLEMRAVHMMEHLFATYVRNSVFENNIIYFGPMGCRTGFYFLTRGMTEQQVVDLTREALTFIAAYDGEIPGATQRECGNYLEHDLDGARAYASAQVEVLRDWTPARLVYPD